MRKFGIAIAIACAIAIGCRDTKPAARAASGGDAGPTIGNDARTTPRLDASPGGTGVGSAPATAPATTAPSGLLALVTRASKAKRSAVEIHRVAGNALELVSTTALPSPEMTMLAWPAGGPLVVGGLLPKRKKWLFGTIVDGKYAEVASYAMVPGELDPESDQFPRGSLIVTATGEVWAEQCRRFGTIMTKNDDGDEEEDYGCLELIYHQIIPERGTAPKEPAQLPDPPADVTAPSSVTLAARKMTDEDDGWVIDCTSRGVMHELFKRERPLHEPGQVHPPPTWRWLSAEPPIAIVYLEHHTPWVVRGCEPEPGHYFQNYVGLGPRGLWVQVHTGETVDTIPTIDVHWRGVLLGTLRGRGLVFADGPTNVEW